MAEAQKNPAGTPPEGPASPPPGARRGIEIREPQREPARATSGGGDATARSLPVHGGLAPIRWDNVIFTHVVIIGVPTISY